MITKSEIEKNYSLAIKKLNTSFGLNPEKLKELVPDLEYGTFSAYMSSGMSYQGSLIKKSIELTSIALNINNSLGEDVRVDHNSIVKVCMLQHISKALKIIPNPDNYAKEAYIFADKKTTLKVGAHSALIAMKCGVDFTDVEFEAITSIDNPETDKQAKMFSNTLSVIVRCANDILLCTSREQYKIDQENKNNLS